MQGEHHRQKTCTATRLAPAAAHPAQQAKRPDRIQGASELVREARGLPPSSEQLQLEQVPQELVVYLVVVLHLRRFDEGSKSPRTPIRRSTLQIGKARLHVGPQELR